jgi:hypothetical protein
MIYRITEIFFACGEELPFGRRSLYPDDPVNPVQLYFKDKNPILFLPYLFFAFNFSFSMKLTAVRRLNFSDQRRG